MANSRAFEPRLLATAIGSFPHADADQALDLILSTLVEAPLWPQLPRADWREGMMVQYLENVPGLQLDEVRKRVSLDIEGATFGLEEVAEAFAAGATARFGLSEEFSRGFSRFCSRLSEVGAPRLIKGHVTGPVTQSLALETNFEERPAIYEPELALMLAQAIGLKARAQERAFEDVAPGVETLIFLDEPSMASIGSGMININAELAVELLRTSASACKGLTGVHCCGETDLGLIAETGIDVLNFDAFDYLDALVAAGKQVKRFVEAGGMLAIGVVPSSLPSPDVIERESAESLWDRFVGVMEELLKTGLDRDLLARRSMITPSCGTGGMTPQNSRRSLEMTAALSRRAQDYYLS